MHNEHAWTERTEDGAKREVRAVKFGGKWRIQAKIKGQAEWTYHEPGEQRDLETLLDILRRKYQRRRASYEDVVSVEQLLGKAHE